MGNDLLLAHVDAGSALAHLASWLEAHGARNDLSNAMVVLAGTEDVCDLRCAEYPGYVAADDEMHLLMNIKVPEVRTTGVANRRWTMVAE